ncbi:radical SAM protein [Conexibacter sp. DBS9H8]|uniref:radical SAM protein n=1 Tax=Conexibacter sp. DBS9H8 TaxID=2937801 RepID=UPI00200CDABC|nr:radical SAM protein [Conexibacter sp. DBS9H8]
MSRIAVLGGPYANPFALAAALTDARTRGCERIFCLGDLGGFGADCDGIWPLLSEHRVECIAGNYDVAIGRGDPDCGCGYADEQDNHYAQQLYDYTREHTSGPFAAWMRTLAPEHRQTIAGVDVHMVHGSPLAINDFFWESLDEAAAAERVRASGADLLLCSHTGIPWQRRVGDTLVVNVGVVGRPANDGQRSVWYAVVDLDEGCASVELVPVGYDWRAQAASMRAAGLPEPFIETIETGWWTTCLEVVPPAERARGRFHLYRTSLDRVTVGGDISWGVHPGGRVEERPVVPLFGTPAFPPRLWIYTNFHCNLACGYCVVASSPRARPRSLGRSRVRELADEACAEGFRELYLTGGEPFLEPDIAAIITDCVERLPTVVLTNATVFTGRRLQDLADLAGAEGLVLQTSLDGAAAATHDAWRGDGSFARAMAGIAQARRLGFRLRVALTETPENAGEVDELRELLEAFGVATEDVAVRPLIRRGFAADVEAANDFTDAIVSPEMTVSADGIHWHPLGGDVLSSPDLLVRPGRVALAEAKALITERFLTLRLADGSLPAAYRCAI